MDRNQNTTENKGKTAVAVRDADLRIENARSDRGKLIVALEGAGAKILTPKRICCPFHDDNNPSGGTYEDGSGIWRYKCQGCGWAGDLFDVTAKARGVDVADVLREYRRDGKVAPADRKPKPAPKPEKKRVSKTATRSAIACEYNYIDEDGVLLFQCVRMEPKDFRQRQPDGNGGWVWNLKGVRRVLYNLPQIVTAGGESFVFVTEGEKDADSLAAEGLIATTCPMGAGKWKGVDDAVLADRHVVILPDNDSAGRQHGEQVADLLRSRAASVRVLHLPDLPDKGDVSDWIGAGGDAEDLLRLAETCLLWKPMPSAEPVPQAATEAGRRLVMRSGMDIDDKPTTFLWERRLAYGALNVIFSRPGRGKSTLAADLAGHVTRGRAWPDGSPCEAGHVLYIKGEGSDAAIRDRMDSAAADPKRYTIVGRTDGDDSPMLDLARDTDLLADAIDNQFTDTKLVIVDTLDSVFPSLRAIDNANVRSSMWPLQEMAERRDVCVVVLAHTNKGGYHDPLDRLSGGRAIGGAARSVWMLGKTQADDDDVFMCPVKVNDFRPASALKFQLVGLRDDRPANIRWGGEADVTGYDLEQPPKPGTSGKSEAATEWLENVLMAGPADAGAVKRDAEQMGFGQKVLRKAKTALQVETKAAKGAKPPRFYMCMPGQTVPDLNLVFPPTE